jgi:hypothetical protein
LISLPVATSTLLAQLMAQAPRDRTTVGWFLGKLEERSFGLLLLVMAVIGLTPGIASFSGFLLAIPSIQMIMGRENPSLPAFLVKRTISTPHFTRWVTRIIPPLRSAEALVHPRWQLSPATTKRVVGIVNLTMAVTITLPFPFAYTIPTLVIVVIAFAYLEEDGLLLAIGYAAALLSLAFSIVQIFAALKAASFLVGL